MRKVLFSFIFAALAYATPAEAFRLGVGPVTVVSPQVVSQYFVAQNGNDGDTGASPAHAWQTIAQVNAQVFAAGTTVSFNGGDSFLGTLIITLTSAPAGNVTINSYGSGQAHFSSGNEYPCVIVTNVSSVTITNIDCEGAGTLMNSSDGIQFNVSTAGAAAPLTGEVVSSNTVVGYGRNGIIFSSVDSNSLGFSNTTINSNFVHDITGRIPSTGGISPVSCIIIVANHVGTPHGVSTNLTMNGNTVFNCIGAENSSFDSGQGIFVIGMQYATISNNVVHDFGKFSTSCGGPSGILATEADSITISFNEVYNGTVFSPSGACDGEGIDLDQFTTNSIVEYNYTHNNTQSELVTGFTSDSSNTFRFNITETGAGDQVAYQQVNGTNGDQVYNNTFFMPNEVGGQTCFQLGNGMINTVIANNICFGGVNAGIDFIVTFNPGLSTGNHIVNNDYFVSAGGTASWIWAGTPVSQAVFQADCGSQCSPFGITTNPNLTSPGSGGTCGGYNGICPTAYDLTASSPAGKGNGYNITSAYGINIGTQDFYGNAVTSTTLPIGAAANK